MNNALLHFEQFFAETLFGISVMVVVILFTMYTFLEILLAYRRSIEPRVSRGRHYEVLKSIAYVMLLVFAQFLALFIWVLALTGLELVSHWVPALLFTASFFTSVGNFTEVLPEGWGLTPSIIAFSGLFSFAWATAATMSMARALMEQLDRHKED